MIQDIKVDIVYYMTATDFEFEFNLGGCCHMRLLTDKAKDKKSFVNALARAVSRSRIIISCGPLFGEDGLIAVTAAAIGHDLKKLDNKAYGVASNEEFDIICDSVPLVTCEGYFGGCIIESGSQSIIILTENRTIRKQIMKNLIHPYIEDISTMRSSERSDIFPANPTPSGGNNIAQEVIFEDDIAEEDESEGSPSKEDKEYVFKAPASDIPDYESVEPEIEIDEGEHNIKFDYGFGEDVPSSKDTGDEEFLQNGAIDDNVIFMQEEEPEEKKKKNGLNVSIVIVALVLLLAVLALFWFLIIVPLINGVSTIDYIRNLFEASSSTGLV